MQYYKYPSTMHLPFSRSLGEGDVKGTDFAFYDQECVVTIKMDGENTSIYRDKIHARSIDSGYHPSRSVAKAFQGEKGWKLEEGVRVIAENMYAQHSIRYDHLDSYLYGIAVAEGTRFWDWDSSCLMFDELGIPSVPVLWRGIATEEILRELANQIDPETQEGFVVRTVEGYDFDNFSTHVAKYVRPHHVQTTEHWTKTWVPNALAK